MSDESRHTGPRGYVLGRGPAPKNPPPSRLRRFDAFAPYCADGHTEIWYCEDGRSVTATWSDGKWNVVPNEPDAAAAALEKETDT